jgi:hypothetical protein
MGGFLQIDMADIPLIEKPQPIIGVGIGGGELNGLEKILLRRVDGFERETPPEAKDRITRCQRNHDSEKGKENPLHGE